MSLYAWLRLRLPRWAAILLTGLWYGALIVATAWLATSTPEAEFRYVDI